NRGNGLIPSAQELSTKTATMATIRFRLARLWFGMASAADACCCAPTRPHSGHRSWGRPVRLYPHAGQASCPSRSFEPAQSATEFSEAALVSTLRHGTRNWPEERRPRTASTTGSIDIARRRAACIVLPVGLARREAPLVSPVEPVAPFAVLARRPV